MIIILFIIIAIMALIIISQAQDIREMRGYMRRVSDYYDNLLETVRKDKSC